MAVNEDGDKAITALNGSQVGGRTLNVNEARPKTEHRGDFFPVANGKSYTLQRFLIGAIHGDVAEHRKVIARAQPAEMRFQDFREPRLSSENFDILLVGIQLDAIAINSLVNFFVSILLASTSG